MSNTILSIQGEKFYINNDLTYSRYIKSSDNVRGLLMNARFIQGIFHDAENEARFQRFGRLFDPEQNTDDLIAALPAWYRMGLLGFTVGFQGGGPCFTTDNATINNNAFSADGLKIDSSYAARMTRILNAADDIGMVVIVSLFYGGQIERMLGAQAVLNAVRSACKFLRDGGWRNVILEVANEYDISSFKNYPLIQSAQGMVALIDLARRESGLLVGSSGGGGTMEYEVALASDVIIFHGNGQSRQQMVKCILKARQWGMDKPIICNEDSQDLTNMQVCLDYGVSWGYYNNLTKQEPPIDWGITPGEDYFFANRMAIALGIETNTIQKEKQYFVHGFEKNETVDGKYWMRLASLYPESINYVDFYKDSQWLYRCYDSPFTINFQSNWLQKHWSGEPGNWRILAVLRNGERIEFTAKTN